MRDFRFDNHGSIVLMFPLTPAAQTWVDEHIPDDATQFGDAIVVEPRYIPPIVDGILQKGLTI